MNFIRNSVLCFIYISFDAVTEAVPETGAEAVSEHEPDAVIEVEPEAPDTVPDVIFKPFVQITHRQCPELSLEDISSDCSEDLLRDFH